MGPHVIAALIIFAVVTIVSGELQGPVQPAHNTHNDINPTETQTDAPDSPPLMTSDHNQESEHKYESTDSEQSNNGRKSSKLNAENPTKSKGMDSELKQRTKMLQAAIFERLWNEKLVKEKLQEEIDLIKERRKLVTVEDPTLDQIKAQAMFEKGMEMLNKPRADKRAAYTLFRKAAAMNNLHARAQLAWGHLLGHWVDLDFDLVTSEFETLAKEGIPEANLGMAFLHAVGLAGKNISQPLAIIHLTLAALGSNTYSQMALGYRYSFGINVPMSCEKSLSYYKKVAKTVASEVTFTNGPVVHRVRLLDEAENSGSHETEIVDYYQLLADKGDVQSQVGLGQLYYQGGKAIQQDHQKALEYFTQAANAGNAIGFAFLGKLYLEGSEFIKADNETAFMYFKKAADLGDPVGQSGLGLMYLKGLGVPKDSLKAFNYFTQAADQGWADGHLNLGNMYFTGNGVKTDFKLALKYFNLASQAGHVLAYYNLGIMHAYGMGMLRSCPAAVEFFKNVAERGRWSAILMLAYNDYKNNRINEAYMKYALLAELGYEVAQSNAAYLLETRDVSIFDDDRHEELIRAFYYWKRSASQGYSAAQVKLGDYYYYGWGTDVDFETAAALYRKASEQQYNAQAMFNLGYMHEQGLGMKKDWHLAKRLYDLAAETNADAKVPVAMALFKLQILAKIEAIKESPYKFIFYLDENISANWDLYMITVLTLLLGTIVYHRRPYQQQQQEEPVLDAPGDAVGVALIDNYQRFANQTEQIVQNTENENSQTESESAQANSNGVDKISSINPSNTSAINTATKSPSTDTVRDSIADAVE